MMLGLVQLLVGFVVAWETLEFVLRYGLLLSALKLLVVVGFVAAASCLALLLLAKALTWVLRRVAKLSIGCRSYGLNYLRGITLNSPKGPLQSISIGEIRLGLRKPITQLGFTILTQGPILQLRISDLDIVLRQPTKSGNKKKPPPRKSTSASSAKPKGKAKGQGKWRLITNVASLLSLSIVELKLKAPKAALGFKELKIDLSKTGALHPVLNVDIHLIPLFVQALEVDDTENDTSVFNKLDWWVSGQYCSAMDTADSSSFLFEDIALSCELHQRDKGIRVKNFDLIFGPIVVNLEEKLFTKKKLSASTVADQKDEPVVDNKPAAKSEGSKLFSLNKKIDLFPEKSTLLIRAEVNIKISGAQCNLIISRIKPLILFKSAKKKPLVLHEIPQQEKAPKEKLPLALVLAFSAPELSVVVYSLEDIPLFHCCLLSTHFSASKLVDQGPELHAKLGELKFLVVAKHQQLINESISGTLLHISSSTLDLEQKDASKDNGVDQTKSALSVNISGVGMHFCFYYLELLCTTAMSYKGFLKSIRPPKKRPVQEDSSKKSTKSAKGAQLVKISVEQCSILYDGDMRLEDMSVADPKRVNFGSQGGRVMIIDDANGGPRMAYVNSTCLPDQKHVNFSTSLEINRFGVCLNKEKHSMQVELGRSRLIHKEYQFDDNPAVEVTLLDVQKAKFVKRSGGPNDNAVCSLINVTDVAVRWEPDPCLELLEVATRLKSVLHRLKLQNSVTEAKDETVHVDTSTIKDPTDHGQQEKAQKKRESVIAIDVESLKISGELADGVEATVHVGSIFSENAKIGVLVEGIALNFCGAQLFKSTSIQISRIPISVSGSLPDKKLQSAATCDWVIQCRDAYICLPFRLQLRAIDDAVEDTLRALKLVSAAKTSVLFPEKKSDSSSSSNSKKSKSKSTVFRYVRVMVRDLTAEIEEEPLQGWLDEHMSLMKNVFNESIVRLDLLDQLDSAKYKDSPKAKLDGSAAEKSNDCPDVYVDAPGVQSLEKLREEIHIQAFKSYYQACQKLSVSKGSGACSSGFQSGFKMSTRRASVMSICAKDVDLSLSKIDGGDEGMISFIKNMDPVCAKNDIPFSRLYGSNLTLKAKSLSAYIRDYTFPLFSGTSAKCNGRLVLGQQINNMPLQANDPAKGLTLHFTKLRLEISSSRGKQIFTFDCKREPLDLVYMGIDMHLLKVFINNIPEQTNSMDAQVESKNLHTKVTDNVFSDKGKTKTRLTEKSRDDGFFLYSDYFTIRKQTPKADAARLSAWQEDGRKKSEKASFKSEFDGGDESDHAESGSDEDGFNVVVADNCQRVFVHGLKILWNLENRAAILSWVGGLTQAFQPPKPSPSRQYTQRKILEKKQAIKEAEMSNDGALNSSPSAPQSSDPQQIKSSDPPSSSGSSRPEQTSSSETVVILKRRVRAFSWLILSNLNSIYIRKKQMLLLAAGSGRVMVRSFHSVVQVGQEMFEKTIGASNVSIGETKPEMTWSRFEVSVMLEHVQAHVAPTDVDPGAGIQWLPKIHRRSSEVKRTGALLERVFMPCQMFFRITRHKGGNPELKVKPLKELAFNSPDITAGMTSRQFQVMMDVLTNLLLARTPRNRKSNLCYPLDDDDNDIAEESDAVVPDGVEEVELAKIHVEVKERERKILFDDIRILCTGSEVSGDPSQSPKSDDATSVVTGSKSMLVKRLKQELLNVLNDRKEAYCMLRSAMQKAAQVRLMEKEKNKSPSCAMRVSMRINKVVWSMLADGKAFSEAEINDIIYDFDRDYKDIGIAQLTTKLFVLRNGLANAKSDTVVAPWNPPSEWGKNAMLRVNARQGAPTDGNSVIESLLVDIYPLKIYLTEAMYRMMWGYFFPGDEQHPQKRQELFKVSTTAGTRRVKKGSSVTETTSPSNQSSKESTLAQKPELDRSWEENVAESVANELVSQIQGQSNAQTESQDAAKDAKLVRSARSTREEKKPVEHNEVKQSRPQKMMDFRNIKISQVELLLTYEGLPFAVSDVRLLMDTFHREDFTGTWPRLFSRVKKHIVWGVLKSVTGMQGKKFKAKSSSQKEPTAGLIAASDFNLSDSDEEGGNSDQLPAFLRKQSDGAGDGFTTSVKGLFSSQKKKAMHFVLKTMKGDGDQDFQGERSENDIEFSPFARQLTITKTKKLIKRHTKKLKSQVPQNAGTEQEHGPELPPRGPSGHHAGSSSSSSSSSDSDEPIPVEMSPKD
ncbi:hypothetical protein ACQ4PT_034073 [Festuca glaucescens]